jgi:pimeloyl-ACP methyl ester carboxylesterase
MGVGKRILLMILVLLILLAIIFANKLFGNGHTRPIGDEQGNMLHKGIAVLEKISLGGMDQWMLLRGNDISNPVLLWLHGGPGSSQMPLAHAYDERLEKEFIVVHWDQRGSGKSNPRGFDEASMSYTRFISDAHQLTKYLKERFGKEKIYLLGHSWGTQIGLELVNRHPEDYFGYIGVSQVVSHVLGDEIAYGWLLERMEDKDHATLEALGPPPYSDHDEFVTFIRLVDAYGGSYDVPFIQLVKVALGSPEYTFRDMFAWLHGANRGSGPMWSEQAYGLFDAIIRFPKLLVPIYLFQGRNDYNTPLAATKVFFDKLEAPAGKQMVIFEDSAHTPFLAEPEKFTEEVLKVKQETYQ